MAKCLVEQAGACRFIAVDGDCNSKCGFPRILNESAPSASSNSDYAAALLRIRSIVRGRGDSVTKVGKVSDVFAGLNLPKA